MIDEPKLASLYSVEYRFERLMRMLDLISGYLIVTCSLGGLKTCVSDCVKATGKKPEYTLKFKAKAVKAGIFDISKV
jgi:hypothetical protein